MARVLLTGMSGTGKSTVLAALRRRGHAAINTDFDGWVLADGGWDEQRIATLLASATDLVVAGTVHNQGSFYDRFERVVLLAAPLDVLLGRLASRSTNPYGHSARDRAEIACNFRTVEPLLRRGGTVELEARLPARNLANRIEQLLTSDR